MKKLLRNLFAAFLFVGIIASCETTDPLILEAQKNIFTQNYDTALAILDRSIANNPENGLPHYYKAVTYAEKAAGMQEVAERKPVYENFRESAITARELFADQEEVPEEADGVNALIFNTWGLEHNKAIEYVNDDSIRATVDEPFEIAVAHLQNAVTINPDSTLSFDILQQVQYLNNDVEGAIETLIKVMEMKSPPPSSDFLRLGIYYSEAGQIKSSTEAFESGVEIYPDSINLVQNLADAYMQAGDRERSVQTIQDLIETDPENAQYRLAMGTQLLQATSEMANQVSDNYDMIYDLRTELRNSSRSESEAINAKIDSLQAANDMLSENINELSDTAVEELIRVTELRPDDDLAYNYLGITYQNKYATLFEKRNNTDDNDLAREYDDQAKAELRMAMEYFEKAVEIDPEKTEYWDVLSRIYTTLDMQEKALEALDKAGM